MVITRGWEWDIQHRCVNLYLLSYILLCLFSGKESSCQCRRSRRQGFDPWVRKIPWRKKQLPNLVFLPGKSQGQRSMENSSPWDHTDLDTTEQLSTHTPHTPRRQSQKPKTRSIINRLDMWQGMKRGIMDATEGFCLRNC